MKIEECNFDVQQRIRTAVAKQDAEFAENLRRRKPLGEGDRDALSLQNTQALLDRINRTGKIMTLAPVKPKPELKLSWKQIRLTVNHPVPSLNKLFRMHGLSRSRESKKIQSAMLSALSVIGPASVTLTTSALSISWTDFVMLRSSWTTPLQSWITASASRRPKKAKSEPR